VEEMRKMDKTFAGISSKLGVSGIDTVKGIKDINGYSLNSIDNIMDLVGEDGVFDLGGVHDSFIGNRDG
ncbi:hypothetical protein PanWU01x14_176890, partial [Parasponia andersonii]